MSASSIDVYKRQTQDIGFNYEFIIPATVDRVPCVFVENAHVVGLDPQDPITVSYQHKVGDVYKRQVWHVRKPKPAVAQPV